MLHSLLSTQPEGTVQIDYLHGDDTSVAGRKRLAEMVKDLGGSITFQQVPDSWVAGLPIRGFTRKATWYRIFLTRLLEDAKRAIYLDTDLLVLDSLRPLWETDLGGRLIGAVTNVPPGPERGRDRLNLGHYHYFNAGVLLLDLAAMRREDIDEEVRQFGVANASRLLVRDQDALNAVLHARRLPLHPRWNVMNSIQWDYAADYYTAAEVAEARANPAIRHFEGPSFNKPWHLLGDTNMQRQYIQHRRETPWPYVRRTGCTPANVLRYAKRRLRS